VDVGESQLVARTNLSINAPRGWTVTLFADNINNEYSRGPGLFGVPDWSQRIRPRTVGVQFDYRLE
jgi:hypothetical protein